MVRPESPSDLVAETGDDTIVAGSQRPRSDNGNGAWPKGATNGSRGALKAGPSNGHNQNDLHLHTVYLREVFGQVLTAGVIGLLLGLAAATIFVHNTFPNLTGYPVQAGLFLAFVALAWILLRTAQTKSLLLWRNTWQAFEQRLAEARGLATRDALTHLQNRSFFYERLQQELETARSRRTPLAILMLDMDDLKAINDEHGHQVGDMFLAHLARVLNQVARPQDVTARLGGDEFAIIMPEIDRRGADAMAQRLWQELEASPVQIDEGTSISVGVSIGLSGFPWGGDSLESIIHSADADLYANKLTRKSIGGVGSGQERKRLASAVVKALSSALDIRDKATHSHSYRVALLAATMARELQLGEDEVMTIEQAAALHDIGKIGVPDSVLWKPTALDPDEWTEMQRHCELGYHILKRIDILADAAEIVYAHHERYDGHGYPRGLAGEDIPLGARVFAVVDAYDAMTCRRPYRDATTPEEALAEIVRNAGSQFDPRVVAAFCQVLGRTVGLAARQG